MPARQTLRPDYWVWMEGGRWRADEAMNGSRTLRSCRLGETTTRPGPTRRQPCKMHQGQVRGHCRRQVLTFGATKGLWATVGTSTDGRRCWLPVCRVLRVLTAGATDGLEPLLNTHGWRDRRPLSHKEYWRLARLTLSRPDWGGSTRHLMG